MTISIILSTACVQLDGNMATWGNCIMESWFYNSPLLMAVIIYALFAIIMFRARLPVEIMLGSFLILSYSLSAMTNNGVLDLMFLLSLLPLAGAIFIAILRRFAR
jgi:hypothetical protein